MFVYEQIYDTRNVMQRLLFDMHFLAWKANGFELESDKGDKYKFSALTVVKILLETTNVNYYSQNARGCFEYAGKRILGKKPNVAVDAQGQVTI